MALPTGLISAAFLTRNLGLELYGLIGVVMAAVGPIAFIAASVFGMRSGVKIMAEASDKLAAASALYKASILIGLIGMLGFALAAPLIADVLNQHDIVLALRIASAEILLLTVVRTHRDALIAMGLFTWSGLAAGIFHIVRLAVIGVMITLGFGIETVMCAIVAGRLAEMIWCWIKLPIPLRQSYQLITKENSRIVAPTFLNGLCRRIMGSIDLLMLAALGASNPMISLFSAAKMLALMPLATAPVFNPGILSALAQAHKNANHAGEAALIEGAWRLISVLCALSLLAVGCADAFMTVIFGDNFSDGGILLSLLLLGAVGILCIDLISSEMIAKDKPQIPLYVSVAMLAFSAPAYYLAVPAFGAIGAAATGSSVLLTFGLIWIAVSPNGLRLRGQWLLRGLISGAFGGAVAYFLRDTSYLIVHMVAGTLVTIAMLFATRLVNRDVVTRTLAQLKAG